ncbi:MAG: hypothetical protein ACW99A_01825 [Candidatus Kariarchaeaceae archaeon]
MSLVQFINLLPESGEFEISEILFQTSVILISVGFALLLLLLFFDSFDQESVLSARNVMLMFSVLISGILMILNSIIISTIINEDEERFSDPDNVVTTNSENFIFVILVIAVFLNLFATLYMGIKIFKTLRSKMKETSNLHVQSLIRKIGYGGIIMIFGPMFAGILNFIQIGNSGLGNILAPFVAILGLYIMIHYFLKGGIFLFQGDTLRRLIIITDSGIPIYSYSFRKFDLHEDVAADSLSERGGQEVLFSGAIKSISFLLSEFTGSNKVVREIFLEDMVMIIKMLPNNSSVILLCNKSTKFLRNALNKFSLQVTSLAEEIPDGQAFNTNQNKVANQLLESSFGFGYYQQMGTLQ